MEGDAKDIAELEEPVPASERAGKYGEPLHAVIGKIKSGIIRGVKHEGTWYIEGEDHQDSITTSSSVSGEEASADVNEAESPQIEPETETIIRYDMEWVKYVLIAIFGIGLINDIVGWILWPEDGMPEFMPLRALILYSIWRESKWLRWLIWVWAIPSVLMSAFVIWLTMSPGPAGGQFVWWTPLLMGGLGLLALATAVLAYKYVEVVEIPVKS